MDTETNCPEEEHLYPEQMWQCNTGYLDQEDYQYHKYLDQEEEDYQYTITGYLDQEDYQCHKYLDQEEEEDYQYQNNHRIFGSNQNHKHFNHRRPTGQVKIHFLIFCQ